MKKISFFLSGVLCFSVAIAQEKPVPAELKPFIMQSYTVLDYIKQDLNNDKRTDYILILKTKEEDTMTFDNANWDAARPLLVIMRQPDGTLKSVADNATVVLCKNCGGVMGDPYQGIRVKPGEFSLDFYGGSSWRWSTTYTFKYDANKNNWYLQQHSSSSFQSGDPEKTTENTSISRSEIGDVSLQKFTPYYNADSSTWKVKALKTYFYTSPDIKSKPKKAYLVKGNTLTSIKQFKTFIEGSFTNNKENTTYGYILKKDLELIEANTPKGRTINPNFDL